MCAMLVLMGPHALARGINSIRQADWKYNADKELITGEMSSGRNKQDRRQLGNAPGRGADDGLLTCQVSAQQLIVCMCMALRS